jgi:hypothetical protein
MYMPYVFPQCKLGGSQCISITSIKGYPDSEGARYAPTLQGGLHLPYKWVVTFWSRQERPVVPSISDETKGRTFRSFTKLFRATAHPGTGSHLPRLLHRIGRQQRKERPRWRVPTITQACRDSDSTPSWKRTTVPLETSNRVLSTT